MVQLTRNVHLHIDESLLARVDAQADAEHVSRTVMIERLLRDGLEARIHGADLRSELRSVLREELTPLLLRGVRDGGIAWRMLYQLIATSPEWEVDARALYEEARRLSDEVISKLTAEEGAG